VPYVFAINNLVGQSVTKSLIDPHSGQLLGQALIDFTSDRILESLTDAMTPLVDGFHVLITMKPDESGNDVVVAPGFDFRDLSRNETATISRYILPFGSPDGEQGVDSFDSILNDMRTGNSGEKTFLRFNNANVVESINFAYAPVSVMSLRIINSSDLSTGTEIYRPHIFSLALGQKEEGLLAQVKGVANNLEKSSHIFLTVFSILIAVAILLVVLLSYRVAVSIITPVAQLLTLTRQMNNLENNDKQCSRSSGSIEVSQVNHMFERLYLLVGFANTAFFSGDLSKAIENFTEALELFTKLENSKAIGVTSNNLGNTMFTIYRMMTNTGSPSVCGITKDKAIEQGRMYFDNAIRLGEQALSDSYEKQGWSTTYLIFLQQLSNRYFNRALFLLTAKKDLSSPEEAEQQGLTDLETAKNMDREVVDNGDQYGFKGDSELHFDLLLGRIKGILLLLQLGYEDIWDIDEIFSEAMEEINRAVPIPDHCLFKTLSPAGQMQRLDAALITYFRMERTKDTVLAARIAIRMLQDDEYVIREAALVAVNALIDYTFELTVQDINGAKISEVQDILFKCRNQLSDSSLPLPDESRDASSRDSMTQGPQSELLMEIF
jgi:tetratricopeptide (TPR) repeat protein